MAKSLRSKVKRAFRAKKREDGVYAATHAARLERLHAKIDAIVAAPTPIHDEILEDTQNAEGNDEVQAEEMEAGRSPTRSRVPLLTRRGLFADHQICCVSDDLQPKASTSGEPGIVSRIPDALQY